MILLYELWKFDWEVLHIGYKIFVEILRWSQFSCDCLLGSPVLAKLFKLDNVDQAIRIGMQQEDVVFSVVEDIIPDVKVFSLFTDRLKVASEEQELQYLKTIVHRFYYKWKSMRDDMLTTMGLWLVNYRKNRGRRYTGLRQLLQVIGVIVRGTSAPINQKFTSFLYMCLLPLHLENGMLDDITCVLDSFHEDLVYVMVSYVIIDPLTVHNIITRVLEAFPSTQNANTSKEVLLLHELEKLLEYCDRALFKSIFEDVFEKLKNCTASLNFRLAQRALLFWKNDYVISLTKEFKELVFPKMYPILSGEPHWNETVNHMRAATLLLFSEIDPDLLESISGDSLSDIRNIMEALNPNIFDVEIFRTDPPEHLSDLGYYNFAFGHILSSGSYSQVRYAKHIDLVKPTSQWSEYAVKIIEKKFIDLQDYRENIEREVNILNMLNHANIISLVSYFEFQDNIYLVLEYASGGDLHDTLTKIGSLTEESAKFMIAEIIVALEYIHSLDIIYGDLKPENVLIHKTGHVKLADFGSAKFVNEVKEGDRLEGTAEYLSPELILGKTASKASDIWALGCMIFEIIAGRPPVWGKEQEEIFGRTVRFAETRIFPEHFSPGLCDLIDRLMQGSPENRIGYEELKSHSFFFGINWKDLHEQKPSPLANGTVSAQKKKIW
eukprot:TRINITY_DN11663_c0_g1_i2.p1 TRINITY_DN11663_c0_g1~~TRINITY_DN11663_c0_g1_i2.p1  ORF type:complete len:664 (-),score=119.10 TRINITY_DN11663_c0_g1_i2:29-2020(-)